ncbi:SH3 domain-containing protein [Streptomyces sp. NBC_00252]|uniref:SH3 domain-containing protein n=1 Tax=Streptomyces sp. NBC_00252 TaxID=2975691 RepID=UPI002E2D4EB1|nr:SH3 domain-containing protein [Streptomyces sp. NBC_00252]
MNKHAVRTALVCLFATVGLITATAGVGHAQTVTADRPVTAPLPTAVAAGYDVTPYENANVLTLAQSSGTHVATLTAGRTYAAYCWTVGETVYAHGITSSIWIVFADGYVSALYFEGGKYAGLPPDAQC